MTADIDVCGQMYLYKIELFCSSILNFFEDGCIINEN